MLQAVKWQVRHALIRYRRLRPTRLISDWARARRLQCGANPRAHRPVPRSEPVVISLSTIPERAALIGPVIASLRDQTVPADRIVLAWPRVSLRTGQPYPDPPALPDDVSCLRCVDVGPASKLLPVLMAEPEAAIIVVDDDVIYPADFVATLLAAHREAPAAAIGYRGWRIQAGRSSGRFDHVFATALDRRAAVDVLLGTWGYLVPPGALDAAVHDFSGYPEAVRWVDDVWISGHLARRGVPRLVVPARGLPIETRASGVAALTFGLNRSGANDRAAIAAFAQWW